MCIQWAVHCSNPSLSCKTQIQAGASHCDKAINLDLTQQEKLCSTITIQEHPNAKPYICSLCKNTYLNRLNTVAPLPPNPTPQVTAPKTKPAPEALRKVIPVPGREKEYSCAEISAYLDEIRREAVENLAVEIDVQAQKGETKAELLKRRGLIKRNGKLYFCRKRGFFE